MKKTILISFGLAYAFISNAQTNASSQQSATGKLETTAASTAATASAPSETTVNADVSGTTGKVRSAVADKKDHAKETVQEVKNKGKAVAEKTVNKIDGDVTGSAEVNAATDVNAGPVQVNSGTTANAGTTVSLTQVKNETVAVKKQAVAKTKETGAAVTSVTAATANRSTTAVKATRTKAVKAVKAKPVKVNTNASAASFIHLR